MYCLSDFKIPFSFENRRPLLQDDFLFIPGFYEELGSHGPVLDFANLFQNDNPVLIEYCSGNGQWIAAKAKENPDLNWVAVERDFERARKIWLKAKKQNLKNLFLVFGEALTFTQYYLKDQSVDGFFVNFPDPWPKRRHFKNRLVSAAFMEETKKKVKPLGTTTLVSDHEGMALFMIESALKSEWKPLFEKPYFSEELEGYGSSYFEDLFRGKGKKIRYIRFEK